MRTVAELMQAGGTFLPGAPLYERWRESLKTVPPAPGGIHPFGNLFPMIVEDDLRKTLRDSLSDGQNHPVVLHHGMLLDGRNRARELIELGKPISYVVFTGTEREALEFVAAENYARRHLEDKQRQMIAAKMANMRAGHNQFSKQVPPIGGTSPSLLNEPAQPGAIAEVKPLMSIPEAAQAMHTAHRSTERAAVIVEKGTPELQAAVEYGPISISAGEKIARLPVEEQPAALEKALPNGNRAIMSSRQEPDDSLDFFPTPPWATRALIERVLQSREARLDIDFSEYTAWEPACGEGHMAEVLREYSSDVLATDVFGYGYGDATLDFTSGLEASAYDDRDFIITNPPFQDKSEAFVLQGLQRARVGVAMFVRLQWLETIGRYERIFKDNPPTLIAFFAERVNLCKGRWDPEGGTATAYIWLVWIKGEAPRAPFWIPPGCREALTRPDDAKRFTQRPVAKALAETAEAAE